MAAPNHNSSLHYLRSKASSSHKAIALSDQEPLTLRRSPRLCRDQQSNGKRGEKARSSAAGQPPQKKPRTVDSSKKRNESGVASFFIGDPVPSEEARRRWPWRYEIMKGQISKGRSLKSSDEEDELILNVECHYTRAQIEKVVFALGDCAYVKGQEGGENYVGKILEFFKTMDGEDYFRVQWFFRAEDTVMNGEASSHAKKRLFYSTLMNDNALDCIVSKVKIVQITPSVHLKSKRIPPCDFYYDMKYSVDYSTFCTMESDCSYLYSSPSPKEVQVNKTVANFKRPSVNKLYKSELALLDVYAGCGGMSTGLCLGAKLCGVDLATKWAIDIDKAACESLKLNHPETQVRNESAGDFLDLLKEWDKLCKRYVFSNVSKSPGTNARFTRASSKDVHSKSDSKIPTGEHEVASLVDICYGDPNESGKRGLHFQVRWVGYGPREDTWEPIAGLSKCEDHIRDFVLKGSKKKIIPRPGDVDVICAGPPCQGISGYNRFRNFGSPLDDKRNHQIVVFMDIINFLKPKYVLMENVIDILGFAKGTLGRYALSRLVRMNYQVRLGIMAAGCYGLPQFRLRVFLWGAHPLEKLPQFPLPTHDVVLKYGPPSEFEQCVVAYDEGQSPELEKALVLSDAISDLPAVKNDEIRYKMAYRKPPETDFQRYIRVTKYDMMGSAHSLAPTKEEAVLFDHRPLPLSEDDFLRVRQIPKRKGANFRDLPGIAIGADNAVQRNPTVEPILLPSGKPLVPDYAINFRDGKSQRPFARLWWDETVPTVLCRPDLHNQAILHPEQDRVLTIRECARLQGFPDYYEFCGDVKDRYRQIGNAVTVSVARGLGYALGMAARRLSHGDQPLLILPPAFSHSSTAQLLHQESPQV
ncbi:DNA (cytosine-5)-methyltransferase CMT2-like isoform X2 [Diospyros lotus]|uniref:DNA (cytosine-5)-methyltransferase CMT2-like isoform X2 n=1 Tax=Diospyros lotus TaxID=55363 RepID=UPI00224F60BB|nr:DNA (cytosine-5)-methyltransferase CMT2-like isoform X2 [Diospyros lotus]